MKNTIILENGIKHELTKTEITVLKELLRNKDSFSESNEYTEALRNLKSLFLKHLD